MEWLRAMNVVSFPASFVNVQEGRSPVCERVAGFPPCMQKRRFVCVAKAASDDSKDDKNSIRLTIQAEAQGKPVEPAKVVIQVSERDAGAESRENVTHVASESAVESPDKVHEQAEVEAKEIASHTGHSVEEVAEDLEHKAEQLSEAEAEHLKSDDSTDADLRNSVNLEEITKVVEETVKATVEGTYQSGQRARQGLEAAREAVEKRAKVLAEAAEDATHKGSQVVEAAKRGLEGLKNQLSKAAGEFQRSFEEMQREDGEKKLKSVLDEEPHEQSLEKHQAAINEDVNTDGERTLKEQRKQEREDSEARSAVSKTIEEYVDPALSRVGDELHDVSEIGDGNEHLKNMNDLVLHDSYAPVEDENI